MENKINDTLENQFEGKQIKIDGINVELDNLDKTTILEMVKTSIPKTLTPILERVIQLADRYYENSIKGLYETIESEKHRRADRLLPYVEKAIKIETIIKKSTIQQKDILVDGDYKIAIISPTQTAKLTDIGLFVWIDNSYEWVQYKSKVIFAFTIEDFTKSEEYPICLGNEPKLPSKNYWFYKEKIYWENDGLDPESVKALADARESKKQRKVEFLKGPETKQKSRRYIDDDVKLAVWRRDNARCVKCGSNKDLEFDHIIPVSMGGSSTERNLQLLCERCNREKGADLK